MRLSMSEIEFKKGDILLVRGRTSPNSGLPPIDAQIISEEDGFSGGWDVYDGHNPITGEEISFYGWSVRERGVRLP